MSADFRAYERTMRRTVGMTSEQLKQLKAQVNAAGSSSETAFEAAVRGTDRYSRSLTNASRQSAALRIQSANIAAQFQDIAVQLQSGASPFVIALQQGTQLSAAFGAAGTTGAVLALKGALLSLISPASLVTIGLIAAGSAAFQYFTKTAEGSEKQSEELRKQASLISSMAKEWGDAAPALQNYADQLERLQKQESLREAGQVAIARIWEEPRRDLDRYSVEVERVVEILNSVKDLEGISQLRQAFDQLTEKFEDGTAKGKDVLNVHRVLNTVLEQGGPVTQALAADMLKFATEVDVAYQAAVRLTGQIGAALDPARRFRANESEGATGYDEALRATAQFLKDQQRLGMLSKENLDIEREIADLRKEAADAGATLTEAQARRMVLEQRSIEARRDLNEAEAESVENYETAAGATEDFIANLERANVLNKVSLDIEREIERMIREAASSGAILTESQARRLVIQRQIAEAARAEAEEIRERDLARLAAEADSIQANNESVRATELFLRNQARINGLSEENLEIEREIATIRASAAEVGAIVTEAAARRLVLDRRAVEEVRSRREAEADSIENYALVAKFSAQFVKDQEELNRLNSEELQIEQDITSLQNQAVAAGAVLTNEQARRIILERQAAEERRKAEDVDPAEELARQIDLIRGVADEWGDAVPALQSYVAELDRLQQAESLREAGRLATANIWAEPREQLAQYAASVEELVQTLDSMGDTSGARRLEEAFEDLQGKVEDQSASAEDAAQVQGLLNQLMASGNPLALSLASSLGVLAGSLDNAANSAARLESGIYAALDARRVFREAEAQSIENYEDAVTTTEQFVTEQERLNSLTREQLDLERETAQVRSEVLAEGGVISDQRAQEIANSRLAAEARRAEEARAARRTGRSGGGGQSEAEKEAEAVRELVEQLELEYHFLGLSNQEREVAETLRKAGAAATEEQRLRIQQLIEATYLERDAIQANEEALENLKAISSDVLGGMFEDLRDGASAAEILANALNRVAESLATAGINQLVDAVFGDNIQANRGLFGGMIIPGILHSGGVVGRDGYTSGRSVPLSVFANAVRMHNGGMVLQPGEVPIIAQAGERVLRRGEGAGQVGVRVFVDQDGNWDAAVTRIAGNVSTAVVGQSQRNFNSTFNDRVNRYSRDPYRRGG
jgi:hypothetical protein